MEDPSKNYKFLQRVILLYGLSGFLFAYGETVSQFSSGSYFPVMPRSVIAVTSETDGLIGDAESLIPFYGSRDNAIIYGDFSAKVDNHSAFALSPGAGLRLLKNNQLVGGYLFGDYSQTNGNGNFFVFNPGLEWMSPYWDAHINAYLPTNTRNKIKNFGLASNMGNYNYISFTGHSEFDQNLIQYGIAGNGFDTSVGYSFTARELKNRVYVGGYHYAANQSKSITGVQVGFQYPINQNMTAEIAGSHDNVSETKGMLTISYIFGQPNFGVSSDVRDRFVDPIPRHLGTINTGAMIPSQKVVKNSGNNLLIKNNIWFFKPGVSNLTSVTNNQCTYENPCTGINQNVLNSINIQSQNANLYFAPGNYFPIATPSPTAGILALANGQSFWGRTVNYKRPANNADRAIMNGVIELSGNNGLDSLQIINNSVADSTLPFGTNLVGVNILNTSNGAITLNNLNIRVIDNSNGAFDIFAAGNSSVTLNDSVLSATEYNLGSANGAENIAIVGKNNFYINHSTLDAMDFGNGSAFGMFIDGSPSNITINDSVFNTTAHGPVGGVGIQVVTDHNSLKINNTTMNTTETNVGSTAGATDIALVGNSNIEVNNSTLNATNVGTGGASAVKVILGAIELNQTTMNVADNSVGGAAGVILFGGSANITHSTINASEANTSNGGAFGVELLGGGSLIIDSSIINAVDNGTNGVSGIFVNGGTATINQLTENIVENGTGEASGVFVALGNATVSGGSFNVTGKSSGLVTGISTNASSTATIYNGATFQLIGNSGSVIGAQANGSSNISIFNSYFQKIISQTGKASGVENNGTGNISAINSNFSITGNGSSLFNSGAGSVLHVGGSCMVNGVPC